MNPVSLRAMRDELEKIAVSGDRLDSVSKSREGIRPLSVDTLLKKDKAGTLFKKNEIEKKAWAGSSVPFTVGMPDPGAARASKKPGDAPTEDDNETVKREDGRGNAATVVGQGQTFNNIAAVGNSAGGT